MSFGIFLKCIYVYVSFQQMVQIYIYIIKINYEITDLNYILKCMLLWRYIRNEYIYYKHKVAQLSM